MDLQVHNHRQMYLHQILSETKTQEEFSETIVPDSYPDIDTIVDSYAQAIVRGKDCKNGSITISGGIRGGILYRSNDEPSTNNLDFYFPFSYRLENASVTDQTQFVVSVRVNTAEGRIINSRKALLRVELAFRLLGYQQEMLSVPEFINKPENLQIKTESYTVQLPLETSEKTVKVSDVLELPASMPAVRICKFLCDARITDQKLAGNRGIFKGFLNCKLLYLGSDQMLHIFRQQFPFSQFCEFAGDYEDGTLEFSTIVTSYDLETDRSEAMVRIPLTAHILMQATAKGKINLLVTEDAYCTKGSFIPKWDELQLDVTLDQFSHSLTLTETLAEKMNDILDTDLYWGYPEVSRTGDQAEIRLPLHVHVLGYDTDNMIYGCTKHMQAGCNFELSQKAACISYAEQQGSVYISPANTVLNLRLDLGIETLCFASQSFTYLSDATIDDVPEEQTQPKVILKRITQPCCLWDLAKQYGSKDSLIKNLNQLSSNQIEQNTVVLIPVG